MDTSGVIQLFIIFILLALSAFFSSSETSLTTVNRIRLKTLADDGNKKAIRTLAILENYGKMLSTILIGNNIVNISASALVTSLAINVFGDFAVGIATGILTIIVLLFGEILPKSIAMINSEKMALNFSGPIKLLMIILTPAIFVVDLLSGFFMRLLRIDPNKKTAITENEIRSIVDVGQADGVIESEEQKIINNVFDFGDALAKDIMIPRIDMITISASASYDELLEVFKNSMYTRIPVYDDSPDHIIGIVNMKDLLLVSDPSSLKITDILRDAYYTYEYKKTSDLMMEMRKSSLNIALVLNEYGATEGMITMEDLLEEIVGELRDEYDEDEEELIRSEDEHTYLIDGSMKINDVNEALEVNLESEDYDSIGGLIIEHLGDRIPTVGESVILDNGFVLLVESLEKNRIKTVRMTISEQKPEE